MQLLVRIAKTPAEGERLMTNKTYLYSCALFIAYISGCTAYIYGQVGQVTDPDSARHSMLEKYPLRPGSIELEQLFSFPTPAQEENGVYLVQGRHITKDAQNHLFISDMRGNAILKFDSEGVSLGKIGRSGQGPGDLSLPHFFHITADNVMIVGETGNMRFHFLDTNGTFLGSFKIFRGYLSWTTDSRGRIFAVPRLHPETKNIIEILSREGEILGSFGEPLRFEHEIALYNDATICLNHRSEIIVGFKHIPIIRAYSTEGTLLRETRIPGKIFEDKEQSNLENQSRVLRRERTYYKPIISDLQPCEKGVVFMHNYPRLEFYEVDDAGSILKSYWISLSDEYIADSFVRIDSKESGLRFYVLQIYPESRVDVFSPKSISKGGHE